MGLPEQIRKAERADWPIGDVISAGKAPNVRDGRHEEGAGASGFPSTGAVTHCIKNSIECQITTQVLTRSLGDSFFMYKRMERLICKRLADGRVDMPISVSWAILVMHHG